MVEKSQAFSRNYLDFYLFRGWWCPLWFWAVGGSHSSVSCMIKPLQGKAGAAQGTVLLCYDASRLGVLRTFLPHDKYNLLEYNPAYVKSNDTVILKCGYVSLHICPDSWTIYRGNPDVGHWWNVSGGLSGALNTPLWCRMLTIGEAACADGGMGRRCVRISECSMLFAEFCCEFQAVLKSLFLNKICQLHVLVHGCAQMSSLDDWQTAWKDHGQSQEQNSCSCRRCMCGLVGVQWQSKKTS